jgi:sporulation protein YabP
MVEESRGTGRHELVLTDRSALEVTGVVQVESFDSEEFLLQTEYGYLGIRGQDLHIKTLDLEQGRVSIEGNIMEIGYLDVHLPRTDKAKHWLGRLFK